MGKEKKKWYQTGEFEDGYQFGDVFRTIKNAVTDKEANKSSDDKIKVSKDKNVTKVEKNDSGVFKSIYARDNIGKLPDADTIARRKGYENFVDLKEYREANPELYSAMNGIKYGTTNGSILEKKNFKLLNLQTKAKNKIIERFKNVDIVELKNAINTLNSGEWQDADTMQKYCDIVDSYVNDYVALEKFGYFDSVPEEERRNNIKLFKSLKKEVNIRKDFFADYEDLDSYNNIMWKNKYGAMTWDELEKVEQQIRDNLLGKNGTDKASLQELQYVKSMRDGFENAEAYDRYVEAVNMPFNELTRAFLDTQRDLQKIMDIEESRQAYYAEQYHELYWILEDAGYKTDEEKWQKIKDDSDGYLKQLKDAEANLKINEKYGSIDALKSKFALLEELYHRGYSNERTASMVLDAMNDPQFSELVTKGKKTKRKNKYMTDIEYDVSCYYDAKGGKDKEKYSEELEDELQRREMKDRQQKFAAFADIMPITASHISVPLNIMAAGEQVIDTAKYVTTGDVDYNTNSLGASTIRSTVSKKIENPIGSFTYNTAMSGVDSLAAMGLSKVITGSSELGSVILGLSAAGNATNDAINRGLSDRYAFASGVAAGVFETLFESWSIGKFSEGVDNLSLDDVENLSTFFGKNLWNNAWEEGLTDVANISYDILVNNKYSQYESSIRNYMISGLSETDAKRQVALELAGQVAEAAASGSLMSFGFSSAGLTKTAVANQINANIERAKNELQLKTTNAVTNPIESYHSEKQSLIRSFLNSVDNEFKKFVQRVKKENNNFERYKISEVSTRETKDIKNLFGIDVSGYTHNINSDGIRHILKRHGENGQQDNTMSNIDDIARVGWVIENYDTVEAITKNDKQVYSSLFTDKNNNPALQIRYSKKINGTYYVVESVFENKYKKLWVQSAYLSNKREMVTQAPDAADRLPMATSKTPPASPTSMLNISQDKKNVNKEETIKGVASQSGAAPFISKDGSIKAVPNITEKDGIRTIGVEKIIDEKAFVEGLWDNDINKEHSIKPDVIDNPETTLKTKLGFIDDSGQLTFIPTNVMITNTKVIAGIDVKNVFRDAKKYVDKYGGNESDYRKVVGKIESAKYIFDIHFVEDKNGNEYDFKIKSKTLKEGK